MISLIASSSLRLVVGWKRLNFVQLKRAGTAIFTAMALSSLIADVTLAGDLSVSVRDGDGELLENAVVTLVPNFDMEKPYVMRRENEMRQENTLFAPFVLPVGVGDSVTFPNFDEFRHHVYSFSKAKRFELRLYGKDETKSIQFDQPGVVALGCNIHDNMLAYIYISEAPIFAKTNVDGIAQFDDLPDGEYTIEAWHPGVSRKGGAEPKIVTVGAGSTEEFALKLRRVWGAQTAPAEGQY